MLFSRKHFRLKYLNELSCCSTNPVCLFECVCGACSINDCPVMSFFLIALHCIALSTPMQLWPYACFVCLLNASCGVFLKFMHLHHCISFRYARRTTCGHGARADGTEPQDGVGWTHPEEKRTRWSNQRPGSKSEGPKALLVLTQCYLRQASEHNP